MPVESQLSHRNVRAANIPYVSNLSPTATDPCYIPGSQDLLTSIAGYAERRPGFATVDATGFHNLQRVFTWDRNDGSFYKMYSDVNALSQATVYKFAVATDVAPVLIYTDTGSSTPFDFVVSNNTVYFSNGHVAQKWDPKNGLSNWGIAIGAVNSAVGPDTTGNGADQGGPHPWTNPNNVTSAVSYATVTMTGAQTDSNFIFCTQFGFAIPAGFAVQGIQITADVITSGAPSPSGDSFQARLLSPTIIGTQKNVFLPNSTPTTITFGGPADLWGTTWQPNAINQTTWGVAILAENRPAGGTQTFSIRNVRATIYGLGGPTISVSGSAGTFSATVGYQYVFCYGNSNTGHVSSPSPVSASTGIFTNKLNVQVSLTASTDPQVNQIRLFRSTDSVAPGNSAAVFFELPTSPYPNTTANVLDNAADNTLNVYSIAPLPGFNDPPTPFRGPVYFAGRIWGFANNSTYFSGLEEITTGVPEESFVSGVAGNFWNFDQPMQGLAVAGSANAQTLLNYCGGRIYGIVGNSLDTFRKFIISTRRGCRNLTAIATLGAMVAWFDSSGQVWGTDGSSMQELGIDIRPDLATLSPANVSMTFHAAGKSHWLVVSGGSNLLVYDLDTEQWMPPWSFASQYVFSGETSAGNYQLFGAQASQSLTLSTTLHNDNGSFYQPIGKTNLFAVVPDFGTRFSSISVGMYDEPTRTGLPWWFEVDTNQWPLADVLYVADDDPLNPATPYTSIFANLQPPDIAYNRGQGIHLVQNIFGVTKPTARWISWQWKGAIEDDTFRVYGFFMAYSQKR